MPTDLTLRCACGQVSLVARGVHPGVANRVACSCAGCRAFARRMGYPEILDEHGATERFQVTPACVSIDAGREHIACLQQTRGGAVRWYAACCRAPLGLTLPQTGVPFLALDVARLDPADTAPLGPVRAWVNPTLSGAAARARGAGLWPTLTMVLRLARLMLVWWWRGDTRRSPLYEGGRPIAELERLGETL